MSSRKTVVAATACAALVVTAQIGGKALRDALFLTEFPVSDLPSMVMLAAVVSITGALVMTRVVGKFGPRRITSALFVASAVSASAMGMLASNAPDVTAVALYIHIAVFGALLMSGVWSTVSEAFDPAAARKHIGTIAAGATGGGLIGGILAERVAAWASPLAMFFVIAAIHLVCAAALWMLTPIEETAAAENDSLTKSLRAVVTDSYLLRLTLLVVFATILETTFDYLLKAEAAAAMDRAELMRFFGAFYTIVGVVTFALQVGLSKRFLERFGPAKSVGLLPTLAAAAAVLLFGAGHLIVASVARGGVGAVRNSMFRSGYELFFAPLSTSRRRSVKTLIDVGSDRIGDLAGGIGISVVLLVAGGSDGARWLMCLGVLGLAVGVFWMTRQLHAGYVATLERQLVTRGGELAMSQSIASSGLLMQTLAGFGGSGLSSRQEQGAASGPKQENDVLDLFEKDLDEAGVRAAIELLGADDHARTAAQALRGQAKRHLPVLAESLVNTQTAFAVRRRLPGIIGTLPAALVTDHLVAGLSDRRFEVRFRCGAALYQCLRRDDAPQVAPDTVHESLRQEVSVSRRLWTTRQVLDEDLEADDLLEKILGARVDRSLQHVFHLLALIHPVRPLKVAFRGLHTDDPVLRGTALEYLATILPNDTRDGLFQVLGEEDSNQEAGGGRALESLLASQASIEMELEAMRKLIG